MLFVDESIQHNLGYICASFVYCVDSPDEAVSRALRESNFVPGRDEYKSGVRMGSSQNLHALRQDIAQIVLQHCKLAIYIAPIEERPSLLDAVSRTASRIVSNNNLSRPHQVFVDQGIDGKAHFDSLDAIELITGCDSKKIFGIQLADYAAYHCSYLLKCSLEGTSKTVQIRDMPHPKAGDFVELDWIIRTEIRRNFFTEFRDISVIRGDDWFFKVAGYGAYYSRHLSDEIRNAARETFDRMYFGCVW